MFIHGPVVAVTAAQLLAGGLPISNSLLLLHSPRSVLQHGLYFHGGCLIAAFCPCSDPTVFCSRSHVGMRVVCCTEQRWPNIRFAWPIAGILWVRNFEYVGGQSLANKTENSKKKKKREIKQKIDQRMDPQGACCRRCVIFT